MTGFRTLSEFYEETNHFERVLLVESLEAYAREREQAGPSGGASGGMGGLSGGMGGL